MRSKQKLAAWRRNNAKWGGYQREWHRAARRKVRALVDEMKRRPCADCGGTFDPICMDFDHRPGETKIANVSDIQRGHAAVLAEIAKCDVVCANCHRLRTQRRGQWSPTKPETAPAHAAQLSLLMEGDD